MTSEVQEKENPDDDRDDRKIDGRDSRDSRDSIVIDFKFARINLAGRAVSKILPFLGWSVILISLGYAITVAAGAFR